MRTLVRSDPFRLRRDLDRWLDFPSWPERNAWLPKVDVLDREDDWMIRVETPGIDPESVDVAVEGDLLSISGSRSFSDEERQDGYVRKEIFEGTFRRTVRLPESANTENISASSRDGILEVVVPRSPEQLPKKVKVEVSTT